MRWLGSAQPAVSLSEAQAFLRVETGEEEALLAGLIRSASGICEAFLNQVVLIRPFMQELPASGQWQRLNPEPIRSISSLHGIAADGAETVMPPSSYTVDIDGDGVGWIRLLDTSNCRRVKVSGEAGIATDPNQVPEAIRQGVLRLVAHLYSARDGNGGEPPAAVTALWRPYRKVRIA